MRIKFVFVDTAKRFVLRAAFTDAGKIIPRLRVSERLAPKHNSADAGKIPDCAKMNGEHLTKEACLIPGCDSVASCSRRMIVPAL